MADRPRTRRLSSDLLPPRGWVRVPGGDLIRPADAVKSDGSCKTCAEKPNPVPALAWLVADYLRRHPPLDGLPGLPGRPPSAEETAQAVAAWLRANPPPSGEPGRPGNDGRDAVGIAFASEVPDVDGCVTLVLTDGRRFRWCFRGPRGERGYGAVGGNGKDGRDGFPAGVQDEGVPVVPAANTLNFIGPNVAVTDAGGGKANVTISRGFNLTPVLVHAAGRSYEYAGGAAAPYELDEDGSIYNPITYPDLFAAVGSMYGASAPTIGAWTARTSGTTADLNAVRYANGLWVAVSNNSSARWSDDNGVTWNACTGLSDINCSDIVYSQALNLWVITGTDISTTFAGRVFVSANGKAFTAAQLPPATVTGNVAEVNGVLIACGIGGLAHRSTDGLTWTSIAVGPPGFFGFSTVAGSSTEFLLAQSDGVVFRSTNGGLTWSNVTTVSPKVPAGLAYSMPLNQYLLVSTDGTTVYSNDNGTTWQAGTAGVAGGASQKNRWLGSFFLNGTFTAGRFDRRNTATTAVSSIAAGFSVGPTDCATNGMRLVAVASGGAIRTADLSNTDYRVPDSRDKFVIGASSTRPQGSSGGSFTSGSSGQVGVLLPNIGLLSQVAPPNHTHQVIPPYIAKRVRIVHTNVFSHFVTLV